MLHAALIAKTIFPPTPFFFSLAPPLQTSSGKTHTMEGPSIHDEELAGVIPRTVNEIFFLVAEAPDSLEFVIKVNEAFFFFCDFFCFFFKFFVWFECVDMLFFSV